MVGVPDTGLKVGHYLDDFLLNQLKAENWLAELGSLASVLDYFLVYSHSQTNRNPARQKPRVFQYLTHFSETLSFLKFLLLNIDLNIIKVNLTVLNHSEGQFLLDRLRLESWTLVGHKITLYLLGLHVTRPYHKQVTVSISYPSLVSVQVVFALWWFGDFGLHAGCIRAYVSLCQSPATDYL